MWNAGINFVSASMATNTHWSPISGPSVLTMRRFFLPTYPQISSIYKCLVQRLCIRVSINLTLCSPATTSRRLIVLRLSPISRSVVRIEQPRQDMSALVPQHPASTRRCLAQSFMRFREPIFTGSAFPALNAPFAEGTSLVCWILYRSWAFLRFGQRSTPPERRLRLRR